MGGQEKGVRGGGKSTAPPWLSLVGWIWGAPCSLWGRRRDGARQQRTDRRQDTDKETGLILRATPPNPKNAPPK